MITINGTPLNDLVCQILALEHVLTNTKTQERGYQNNRVELLLDEQKFRGVLEPICPPGVSIERMLEAMVGFYGMDNSNSRLLANAKSLLREHFRRDEGGSAVPLFPKALRAGVLSVYFTSCSKSVGEMVETLGVQHEESYLVRKEEDYDPVNIDYRFKSLEEVPFPEYSIADGGKYVIELYDPMTAYQRGKPLSLYCRNQVVDADVMTLEFDFYDGLGSWNQFDNAFRGLLKDFYGVAPYHMSNPELQNHANISYGYSLKVNRISPQGYDDVHVSLSFSDPVLFERVVKAFSIQFMYPELFQPANGKRADPAPK